MLCVLGGVGGVPACYVCCVEWEACLHVRGAVAHHHHASVPKRLLYADEAARSGNKEKHFLIRERWEGDTEGEEEGGGGAIDVQRPLLMDAMGGGGGNKPGNCFGLAHVSTREFIRVEANICALLRQTNNDKA